MEITELRIGNLYESAKFRLPVTCELSDLVEIYSRADGAEADKYHVVSVFLPIPLTVEWLIRFGFKPIDKYTYTLKGIFIYNRKRGFVTGSKKREVNLKYVHQLQDLYFALTGRDLELKTQTLI